MILILIAVVLAYGGMYAGKEIATEGAKSWGGLKTRVQREGHPAAKAGVGIVSGLAWVTKTAGRGVRSAVRDDIAMVREALTPEGKKRRAEAAAHRENKRRRRREWHDAERVQRDGARQTARARRRAEYEARNPDPTPAPASAPVPDYGTPQPPAAPATGKIPTIGDVHVPQATGDAQTYEQMQAELALLAADGDRLVADANMIAQASERLDAAAVRFKLDPASRTALSAINAACADVAQTAGGIRVSAVAAGKTVTDQQGRLAEAHADQPNAADEKFLKV